MTEDALLLDTMLGKLATYLRMCGFDAAYALDRGVEADDAVADLAQREGRRLVTRDATLAAGTDGAILLTAKDIVGQLRELETAGFVLELDEPSRCSRCNGRLERVDADSSVPGAVPDPDDRRVWRCPDCGQYFWKGSHWDDVAGRLESV